MSRTCITLCCLAFFLQCNSSSDKPSPGGNLSETAHPTPENIPKDDETAAVLSVSDETIPGEFCFLSGLPESLEERFTLGTLDTKREELFSRIEDIVIDSNGRMFILDLRRHGVGVFGPEGNYITTLGRKGQGPGEFDTPSSLALYRDSLLFASNGTRIEIFDITGDPGYATTMNLESPTRSICILGNTLFAHSPRFMDAEEFESGQNTPVIDAYSADSHEHLFSFGRSYQSSNPAAAQRMSTGSVSCNEASATVLVRFEFMPVIQGYAAEDGRFKWTSRIDGLSMSRITEWYQNGKPGFSYGRSEGEWTDFIRAAVNIRDEYQVIQVRRSYTNREKPAEHLSSF